MWCDGRAIRQRRLCVVDVQPRIIDLDVQGFEDLKIKHKKPVGHRAQEKPLLSAIIRNRIDAIAPEIEIVE